MHFLRTLFWAAASKFGTSVAPMYSSWKRAVLIRALLAYAAACLPWTVRLEEDSSSATTRSLTAHWPLPALPLTPLLQQDKAVRCFRSAVPQRRLLHCSVLTTTAAWALALQPLRA